VGVPFEPQRARIAPAILGDAVNSSPRATTSRRDSQDSIDCSTVVSTALRGGCGMGFPRSAGPRADMMVTCVDS